MQKLLLGALLLAALSLVACTSEPSSPADGARDAIVDSVQETDDSAPVSEEVADDTTADSEEATYTLDELAMYNGKGGMPAYFAIDGVVYDASEHAKWMEGSHGGQMAGTDITEAFKTMGHNDDRYTSLPVVGTLVSE